MDKTNERFPRVDTKEAEEAWKELAMVTEEIIIASSKGLSSAYNPYYYSFNIPSRNPQLRKKHNLFPEMRSGMPVSRRKRDRW